MAHEQHGLRALRELAFEPLLRGHVEEVVGFVEKEHVGVTAEQDLEREALLLTAREGRAEAGADRVERTVERRGRTDVPENLLVVAAGLAPHCVRACEPHARALTRLGLRPTRRVVELFRRAPHRGRRQRQQQFAHGAVVGRRAHQLAHEAQLALDVHGTARGALVSRQDA